MNEREIAFKDLEAFSMVIWQFQLGNNDDVITKAEERFAVEYQRILEPCVGFLALRTLDLFQNTGFRESQFGKEIARLEKGLHDAIRTFETSQDPKSRYRAASRICRLVERRDRPTNFTSVVFGEKSMYIPTVESYEGKRIPRLEITITTDTGIDNRVYPIDRSMFQHLEKPRRSQNCFAQSCEFDLYIGRTFGVRAEKR